MLLLEAGGNQGHNLNQQVPIFFAAASEDPLMAWSFFVNHYTDNAQNLRDSKMTWKTPDGAFFVGPNPPAGSEQLGILYPRTGTLGGCSTHNACIAMLAHNSDWNRIASNFKCINNYDK